MNLNPASDTIFYISGGVKVYNHELHGPVLEASKDVSIKEIHRVLDVCSFKIRSGPINRHNSRFYILEGVDDD